MADFAVRVRRGHRDVEGLVLDLQPRAFVLDAVGRIRKWVNRAPPTNSVSTWRFGDAYTNTASERPLPAVNGSVYFDGPSGGRRLYVPTVGTFPSATEQWAIGFGFRNGISAADPSGVFSALDDSVELLTNSSGVFGWSTPPDVETSAAGIQNGAHLFAPFGDTTAEWQQNGSTAINGSVTAFTFPNDDDEAAQLGRLFDSSTEIDGYLDEFLIWNRVLSTKERDLAFTTLANQDNSIGEKGSLRASVRHAQWTDGTADPSKNQVNRLNALPGKQPLYVLATIPAGESTALIQLSANVDGVFTPDSGLGGDLYQMAFIESATTPAPSITQDTGYSALCDVRVTAPGHYTMLWERPNHGALYVHFDVEQG